MPPKKSDPREALPLQEKFAMTHSVSKAECLTPTKAMWEIMGWPLGKPRSPNRPVSPEEMKVNLELDVLMEMNAVQAIRRMVGNGQAASIFPVSVVSDEIRRGRLSGSAITANGVRRQIVLAHRRHRQMTRASGAIRPIGGWLCI